MREIQNDSPNNFEIFCKKILEKMGGNCEVIGGPYDGGIDFIAYDLSLSKLNRISTIGSKIQLVGQAKRYTNGNNIKEKELREFIGASTKIIHEFKQNRSERFGIFQPIILAFWTTSDFHSNAKSYAKKFGIWYLNGIALCQLAIELGVKSLSDSN